MHLYTLLFNPNESLRWCNCFSSQRFFSFLIVQKMSSEDITGEASFMKTSAEKYDAKAKETKALNLRWTNGSWCRRILPRFHGMCFCLTGKGERQEFPAGGDSEEELNTFQMSYIYIKKSRSGMLHLTKGCHVFDWEVYPDFGVLVLCYLKDDLRCKWWRWFMGIVRKFGFPKWCV